MAALHELLDGMRGICFPFGGTVAPSGFLMCYGQAVSRADYAALFSVVNTSFGAGDGSTTFNVPDIRGRIPAGKDNMGGAAASRLTTGVSGVNGATLGASGGNESHTLTTPQIPSHNHSAGGSNGYWIDAPGRFISPAGGAVVNLNTIPTTDSTGGGQAHPNVQPTIVMNYVIKT